MAPTSRALFVVTILTGSFLLFLVQPMVARMALPRLGGAPNVWNSAMLVYQALLLAGYGYAHWLGGLPFRKQATIHLAALVLAALWLPIGLADLPPPAPGWEALWVPGLLALTIGPVFLLVSAQAPLMQRWFSLHPAAIEPWALYAASNLGSFTGLLAYPLLVEPALSIAAQSWLWTVGYGLLILLIGLAAASRWRFAPAAMTGEDRAGDGEKVGWRRIALWLALSAVPSGLMLSTTTHLTTDVFAMPLLWVIPLGLYLLSFVVSFSDRRRVAWAVTVTTPFVMMLAGGMAMASRNTGTMSLAVSSVLLLFMVCVALHARLYDARPDPRRLTLFYFVMSAGGALGGLFTALIAPTLFDWVWEHPLLILAAAVLLPREYVFDLRRLPGASPHLRVLAAVALAGLALFFAWKLSELPLEEFANSRRALLALGVAVCGTVLVPWRPAYVALLGVLMLVQGGVETIQASLEGLRSRSYFGIYTVRDYPDLKVRMLSHGTTLHGEQSTDPAKRRNPTTYYGPTAGVGLAFANAEKLYGPAARIGVVGLGTGTLACYHRAGQSWRFYEIDPTVLRYSQDRTFTYLADCAPDAKVVLGDARLELAKEPRGAFDLLAIDAFSSDSIPLHLLTDEALGIYLNALSDNGVLLFHISNRFIDLEPVLAAAAGQRKLHAMVREDNPAGKDMLTGSVWVLLTRDPKKIGAVQANSDGNAWRGLPPPARRPWTDDHASVFPFVRWHNMLGKR
ncbi:MAG: class I SAM-dependent methyltransferase [Novosphingobium sp.]